MRCVSDVLEKAPRAVQYIRVEHSLPIVKPLLRGERHQAAVCFEYTKREGS